MVKTVSVKLRSDIYLRTKEFSTRHKRSLSSVIAEALGYWLDTCGQVHTEKLLEELTETTIDPETFDS